MTIIELANELDKLIEAGYGDVSAVVGIPTLYIDEDGDILKNPYRDKIDSIDFSAKEFLEYIEGFDPELKEIKLHTDDYDTCTEWDYFDDWKVEEEDENLEEPMDESDSEDPDAWVPCHEIDLYDNEKKEN